MKLLLLCTVFMVGCQAIPQTDGTVKHEFDAGTAVEAATVVAPFISGPMGIALPLIASLVAAFGKKDNK